MEPFEIEIHEICVAGIYVHRIKIASDECLNDSCHLLNQMLQQCDQYLVDHQHSIGEIKRKFLFATSVHKEVMWQDPKYINSRSLAEFFEDIKYDPTNPDIEKTLTCV